LSSDIRLDAETEMLLNQLARHSGCSESDVLREAVRRLAEERISSGKDNNVRRRGQVFKRSLHRFRNAYRKLAK